MPKKKPAASRKPVKTSKRPIEQYDHRDKQRANNPHVGIVTAENDPDGDRKAYAYDPHLDPALQWAGKAEHTSFEVPTVSLHVHERIDPKTIRDAVRTWNDAAAPLQQSLFGKCPPPREAVKSYQQGHDWKNRIVAAASS